MSETTINPAGRTRPARPQAVLAVQHREWLSPHTVRITAAGPGFEAFGSETTKKQTAEAARCTLGKRCWGIILRRDEYA